VAAGLARFAAHNYHGSYFATYWITEAGYDVLGILVMYEVLRAALGNLTRSPWGRLIFPAVLVAGIGLSFARAQAAPPQAVGMPSYIVIGEIAVRFVQVLIFAGLVTLVPILGLRWRQYSFGIATGFGVYATIALLTTTKYSDFGTRFKLLWGWTLIVAYSLAELTWIWFFSTPQKPDPETPAPTPEKLEQYQAMLEQYLNWLRRMRWRCFR
jgi:hypothetical protein